MTNGIFSHISGNQNGRPNQGTLAKSPIRVRYGVISFSEPKICYQSLLICVVEMLGYNLHVKSRFSDGICDENISKRLDFCPNQGTLTLQYCVREQRRKDSDVQLTNEFWGAWGPACFLQWQQKLVRGTFSKTIGYFETGEVIILRVVHGMR